MYRQTRVKPPELVIDPIPIEIMYVWDIYTKLHYTRDANTPLNNREILAYVQLSKFDMQPWEHDAILTLDRTWQRIKNES